MSNRRTTLTLIGLVLLGVAVLAGLGRTNYRYAVQNPGGNDFLPRYVGTRLFLKQGLSPYSNKTTREIQKQTYGRGARVGEDQNLFVYPFYSIVVFAPFATVEDYNLARAMWMTILEISLGLLTVLGISLSQWKVPVYLFAILLLFSILWYHGLRPVINGNASVVCALFIALAFICIRAEQDFFAGLLLALASIKPQIVVLLIPFVLLWAVSQRRWALFWSILASLGFLVAVTSLLLPNWIVQNVQQMLSYPEYTLPGSPGAIFASFFPGIGRQLGWVLTILMVALLVVEWWAALGKEFRWFLWAAYFTLAVTNLIGVRTATENYIVLLPGLILVFSVWDERWGILGKWLVWISLLLLSFGLWGLFLKTIIPSDQPLQHPIMFFPLPIFMVIGLYWVRWWATRPPRVYLDQLKRYQALDMD